MSFKFDASTERIDYGNISSTVYGGGTEFSVSAWVRFDNLNTGNADEKQDQHIVSKILLALGNLIGFSLFLDDEVESDRRRIRFYVGSFPIQPPVYHKDAYTHAEVAIDQWYHVVGVNSFSGNATKLYLDRVLQTGASSDNTTTSRAAIVTQALEVGNASALQGLLLNPDRNLRGNCSQIAIWSTALTGAQAQLLESGADPRTVAPDDLEFYAPLEIFAPHENPNNYAKDIIGPVTPTVNVAEFDGLRPTRPVPFGQPPPKFLPAMRPMIVIVGHVTPTSANLMSHIGRVEGVHKIQYSTDTQYNNEVVGTYDIADKQPVMKHPLTGLQAATTYNYRLVVDGNVMKQSESTFKTATSGPHAFTFVFGSCGIWDTLLPPITDTFRMGKGVWDAIDAMNPDFLIHAGDVWYSGFGDVDAWALGTAAAFKAVARENMGELKFAQVIRRIPTYFMPDDHEWTDNVSADERLDEPTTWNRAFDNLHDWLIKPGPGPLNTTVPNALWYTFTRGKVDFFFLDVRTQRSKLSEPVPPPRIMLGTDQVDDLLAWLDDGSGNFKVILSPVAMHDYTLQQAEGWAIAFDVDRDALLQELHQREHVFVLSGDEHWGYAWRYIGGQNEHDVYEFGASPFAHPAVRESGESIDQNFLFKYAPEDGDPVAQHFGSFVKVTVGVLPASMKFEIMKYDTIAGQALNAGYTSPVFELP